MIDDIINDASEKEVIEGYLESLSQIWFQSSCYD